MKNVSNIKKKSRLFLLFFFIIFFGCSTSRLELFYSGNLNGIIEDCHCPRSTQGSILNNYTFYRDSIENNPYAEYLYTGNIYAYNRSDRENLVIGDIIEDLGIDFITPGRNDFSFTGKTGGLKTLSFNIQGAEDYHTIKAGKLKIAVTGMIDKSFSKYSSADIIEDKSISELTGFIRQLGYEADIIIFVSNLESGLEKKIFNEIEEIDIMISNSNQKYEEFRFGNRLYLSPGMYGECFGKLVIEQIEGIIVCNNSFTKLSFEKFKDDPELKKKTDSLRVKYRIELKENYSD